MKKLFGSLLIAAATAFTLVPAVATAAPSKSVPSLRCIRKVSHNSPGIQSYTVTVYNDPCHQPIKAAAYCYDKDLISGIQWWKWYYGGVLHGRGKTTADCTDRVSQWIRWGYEYRERAHGKWLWHELGHNITDSHTARRFACGYLHGCFFQFNDWTGNVTDYTATDMISNYGTWREIPQGTRGSFNDNNNDNVQVYAANTGQHQTVFSNTRVVLGGTFGWWCTGPWNTCNQDLPS